MTLIQSIPVWVSKQFSSVFKLIKNGRSSVSKGFALDSVVSKLGRGVHVYMVGGAVRDLLMGKISEDRDWVVVGASPEIMLSAGFLPVGQDFPVFLHPTTHEEYALARTERKTAPGYKGFIFHADEHVTLEQDLERRDLTINAIAIDHHGRVIDPFHGQRDIQARCLRHVSDAFKEDPVRILRLARFAARLHVDDDYFSVATETMKLCREMVEQGEVDALVAERVWQEIARGLMATSPRRMLDVLIECGALNRIVSVEVAGFITHQSVLEALDQLCLKTNELSARWALLWGLIGRDHHSPRLSNAHMNACKHLKVPNDVRDLAALVIKLASLISSANSMDDVISCFEQADVFRKPQRWQSALDVVEALYSLTLSRDLWNQALTRLSELALEPIVEQARCEGVSIPEAVAKARRQWLESAPPHLSGCGLCKSSR